MAGRTKKQEPEILEIDGIPTAAGLARESRDLAYKRADGKIYITPAGHIRLGKLLRQRGRERDGSWTRPPSSGIERNHS